MGQNTLIKIVIIYSMRQDRASVSMFLISLSLHYTVISFALYIVFLFCRIKRLL